MPIFNINYEFKAGSQALSNLQSSGDDLVKAMKAVNDNTSRRNTSQSGTNEGVDAFRNEIVSIQGRLEGLNESDRQLSEGNNLLDSVIKMMETPSNGVIANIKKMENLWSNMTETGRELQNSDLQSILKIKKSIEDIRHSFANLRYNGYSVFSRRVNLRDDNVGKLKMTNVNSGRNDSAVGGGLESSYTTTVDFIRFYEQINQNLQYIHTNITNYTEKLAITTRFNNCGQSAKNLVKRAREQKSGFGDLKSRIFYAKRKSESDRDNFIRERQNQLSVGAVVNILERN
jgi:hypothetical protein